MGWMIGVRFPPWAGNFSLRHRVQTGSGAHTSSYPKDTVGSFPGSEANHLLHVLPRIRIRGFILPLPHMSSLRGT